MGLAGRRVWRAGQNEAVADQGEAMLGEFSLEKLTFRSGEEVGGGASDAWADRRQSATGWATLRRPRPGR
jgi:hypothetical protein